MKNVLRIVFNFTCFILIPMWLLNKDHGFASAILLSGSILCLVLSAIYFFLSLGISALGKGFK